jgi:UPF0755 protein
MTTPVSGNGTARQFTVQPGWGGGRIATELADAGLIRSSFVMVVITATTNTGDSLKAGTYELSPAMSSFDIVRTIASGNALSSDVVVTIPEGMNAWEIDDLLTARSLISEGSFARSFIDFEGMLFPDTYRFPASTVSRSHAFSDARLIGDALRRGFDAKAKSYTDAQVIVASMLEKEAKTADDMALVAGIIVQRQKLGMPLQLDATVAYGWCLARWLPMSSTRNCDVTQAPIAAQVNVDGQYNTYTRIGLPKGPIANPGLRALEAAAHPKASPYLYYLSTRDGSQLIFAKTLDEHLRNRAKYLGL